MYSRANLSEEIIRIGFDPSGIVKLDIGCGLKKREGYLGLDKDTVCNPDILHDLESGTIPIEDGAVDYIYTSHTLEHLRRDTYLKVINEFWRILSTGGIIEIIVPYFRTKVAVQDPGHHMQFCEDSFKYLDLSSSPHSYYVIPDIRCNFEVSEKEIKGSDYEHLMLHVTLTKKDMPTEEQMYLHREMEKSGFTEKEISEKGLIDIGPHPYKKGGPSLEPQPMCTGFRVPSIEEVAKDQERFEKLTKLIPPELSELIKEFPALFNVAAECAQLRLVHRKTAYNVLGEDGFLQELLNVQRKWVRLYGMCFNSNGEPPLENHVQLWKIRKQLFDLINYAIAALETFDADVTADTIALLTRVKPDLSVEGMVNRAILDSGGYPDGTKINPRILPTIL